MAYETSPLNVTQPRRGHFAALAAMLMVTALAGVAIFAADSPAVVSANKGWFGGDAPAPAPTPTVTPAPKAAAPAPTPAATPPAAPSAPAAAAAVTPAATPTAAAPTDAAAAPAAGAEGKVDAYATPEIMKVKQEMEATKASVATMVPHSEEYNKARAHILELKTQLDPLLAARKAEIQKTNDDKKAAAQAKIDQRNADYQQRQAGRASFASDHHNATDTSTAAKPETKAEATAPSEE